MLNVFSQIQAGLSEIWLLSREVLYQVLDWLGAVHDDLIELLSLTRVEFLLHMALKAGVKCLINNETSLIWLMIQNALSIRKRSFAMGLVACVWCGEHRNPLSKPSVIWLLCELIKGCIVHILHR